MDSDKKLTELSLYIADKSKDDLSFGATKLNKILFVADFYSYGLDNKPITGAEYVHRENGPTPKRMPVILEALVKEGRAEIKEQTYFNYSQKRLLPLKGADTSIFEKEQLAFVDAAIDNFKSWNATQFSKWTHDLYPWSLSREGEIIPYYTVFSMTPKIVEQQAMDWAKEEIHRIEGS